MAYELIETSEQDGSPRLLFVFTFGNTVWRFTNHVLPIVFDGNTYTPAQIDPTAVVMSSELARDNITLNMPINQQPGPTVLSDFENVLTVTILRGHIGDPDGEFISFWKGRAVNFQIDRQTLKIHCEPVFSSLRRPGLNAKYQRSCRWSLYGRGCWVEMEEFAFYTTIKGAAPPIPIIPPENALIYIKGTNGFEIYNMDVSPFTPTNLLSTYPETIARQIAYSSAANLLLIASDTQIYRFRTNRKPYQQLAPIAAPVVPRVMELSPNGRYLFFGEETAGQNFLIDLENNLTHFISVETLTEAKFSPDSRWLVYTRGSGVGLGFRVFDLNTWPPTSVTGFVAQDTAGYTNIAIRTGNILVMNLGALQDTFIYSLNTKALLRVFSTSFVIHDMIFTPDGTKFILLMNTGLHVYDSTNPDPNTWTLQLPIISGLPTNNSPANRKVLSVSADSRYLALWQTNVAGDQRIVFDLTLSPIQRVASFDTMPPGASFLSTQIVGDFI